MIPEPVSLALKQIVPLVVAGRMEDIERIESGGRMKPEEWRTRIKDYGRKLTLPPPGDFELADVVPMQGKDRSGWSVWYRLWTEEEGRSDLGLQLLVFDQGGIIKLEVDDLRVA